LTRNTRERQGLTSARIRLPSLARTRECEGRVGVEALEPAGARLAADPAGQLGPQAALLVVGCFEARSKLEVFLREPAPALDAARGLDPRDRLDQVRAGQVVTGRERLARLVERLLLGDRGPAERAADDDPTQRSRRAA
jgi:hypothetical protein